MAWAGSPKGFKSGKDALTEPPKKDGSTYTSGVLNINLDKGLKINDEGKEVDGNGFGWMVMRTNTVKANTGRDLVLDFAVFRSPTYFCFIDTSRQKVELSIKFYSMIDNKYDDDWTVIDTYQIGNKQAALPGQSALNVPGKNGRGTAASAAWNDYKNCYKGAKKPAYGLVYVKSLFDSGQEYRTYDDYADACEQLYIASGKAKTPNPAKWGTSDEGPIVGWTSVWPFGVRYISNGGNWAPEKLNVDGNGIIKTNYYNRNSFSWSQQKEDGGNNKDGYKTVHINEGLIKKAHGTVTGVTAFKLRWRNIIDKNIWYYPSSKIPDVKASTDPWVQIDNPQIGLLDWGQAGSSEDWPPRYDAIPIYREANGTQEIELQAKHHSGNSGDEWSIF